MLVASLIALISIHWSIFILSLLIDIISYFLPKLIDMKLEKATIKVSERNNEYLATLSHWFSGLNELRRYFAGAKLLEVQNSSAKKLEKANVNQVVQQQLLTILNGVSELLSTIVLLGATGILVEHKVIIFGAILSVQNFANNVSFGMQTTIQGLTMMRSTKPLMAKISKDVEPISVRKKTNVEVPYIIETQNLALNFPNGETLQYPDLKINQGEKILLSGDSGSGKTTLFKLLLGIIEPSRGQVKFKNKKNEEINPDFSKIGYIPQEPNIFPGTIKQNITMFNSELTSKVKRAIEEVKLDSDIKKFKNGANTELDLNKLNISGGQRQKIVLARAKIYLIERLNCRK